jgi:hypothetical protein
MESPMRLSCAIALATLLWALPLALGGGPAVALVQLTRPASERQLLLEAIFECGMFDGGFKCKQSSGAKAFGKNSTPGAPARSDDTPEGIPDGSEQAVPNPSTPGAGNAGQGTWETTPNATSTACQNGMVGSPPNCHCPKNSELLGGNCVHYTATCSKALPADSPIQPCQRTDERLACTMRQDGLKDCCCLLYDKL